MIEHVAMDRNIGYDYVDIGYDEFQEFETTGVAV